MSRVLVAGAGGFIGGWLTSRLLQEGHQVRAVDIKPLGEWHQVFDNAENNSLDLSLLANCMDVCIGIDEVYNLAADMGGMGFIENNKAACMLSVLINTHLLIGSRENGIKRYFFASSACVYNAEKQKEPDAVGLKESDAYPAMPEDGYGWEKLFSERMCRHFFEDFGLETRIARFHNVYGPNGTWHGGREKAPAALCRKIADAKIHEKNEIEIWGDGIQTRSFTFIDDCIEGSLRLMNSDVREPINIGSNQMVSINEMVEIIERVANYKVQKVHDWAAPKGVRGRNSDNSKILEELQWSPSTPLEQGLLVTYKWIELQLKNC